MVRSAHRRLRRRSLLALGLIAATGVALVAGLLVTLDQTATAEVGVYLAGRQRMLSQRIARDALQAARGGPADPAVASLAAHAADLRRVHAGLRDGDPALGLSGPPSPEVAAAFTRLDGTVRSIAAASEALVEVVEAEEPEAAAVALGGDTAVRPSVSIGAVDSMLAHETEDEVMNAADRAMYRAKAPGRGRVGTAAEVRTLHARRA